MLIRSGAVKDGSLLGWSDLVGGGGLIWWADFGGLVWRWSGVGIDAWSDLWSDLRLIWLSGVVVWSEADLMDCRCGLVLALSTEKHKRYINILLFYYYLLIYGLTWRSDWGRWSGLTAENEKDENWGNSSDKVSQSYLIEKRRKNTGILYFSNSVAIQKNSHTL